MGIVFGTAKTGLTESGSSFTITGFNCNADSIVQVEVTIDDGTPNSDMTSVTGEGLTFVEVAEILKDNSVYSSLWRAHASSAIVNGTFTVNYTSDGGLDAVGIAIPATGTKATAADPDLGIGTVSTSQGRGASHSAAVAETASGNMVAHVGYETEASEHTPGSGYIEQAQVATTTWASAAFETNDTEHDGTGTTTVDGTFNSQTDFAIIRVELLAAPAGTTHQLAGSIAGVSTVAGNIVLNKLALAGSITGLSTLVGDIVLNKLTLAGSIAGASTLAAATIAVQRPLAGSVIGVSSLVGDIILNKLTLAGSIAGVSTLDADLTVVGTVDLAGSIGVISGLAGDLAVDHPLAGVITGASALVGNVLITRGLAGPIAGISSLVGQVNITRGLAGGV
ncbi:hypothetical protein LCGC14_1906400, partial [marine sediment metagenome]